MLRQQSFLFIQRENTKVDVGKSNNEGEIDQESKLRGFLE